MTVRTLVSLLRGGRLGVLLGTTRALPAYYRVLFLATARSSGLLARLADGPVPVDRLAAGLGVAFGMRDGLEAWLRLGASLGVLRSRADGWTIRGRLARRLADPAHDAAAALIEEAATLHHRCVVESPARMRDGRAFTLADVDGPLVARSSRM